MLNIIQNTIGALARKGLSVIRNGLKMWLPFEKSELLGEDVVTNGDFATDSDWTSDDSSWAISGGKANATNSTGFHLQQAFTHSDKKYRVTYTISNYSSGNVLAYIGGTGVGTSISSNGTYTEIIQAAGSNNIFFRTTSSFSGSIDNISVKEVTQIAPDKSNNSNSAKLFTGKALSFDGINDYVDLGSDVNSGGTVWTTAIWIGDYTAGSYDWIYGDTTQQSIGLSYGSVQNTVFYRDLYGTFVEFSCDAFKSDFTNAKRLVFTSDGTDISLYIDGEFIDSITPTSTVLKLSRLMAGYDTTSYMVAATVSDFQLYNTAWTQADVTFDYNNPQHLVTDNSASSITLSNLKGYWHLSEGDGAINYDSSGEDNDGTIIGATWEDQQATIPQLGLMDWAKSTPVADEITLIADPNNPSEDILGNSVRLREHSLNLDGDSYAKVPDADSLDFGTDAFTIQFWAKPNSIANNMRMVTKGITGNGEWMISFSSSDNVRVFAKDSNGNSLDTGSSSFATLSVNTWAMVSVVIDTPNDKILFYKGNQSTPTEHTGASWSGNFNSTKPIVVGDHSSFNSTKFDGLIDDVRIYNRALSSDEVEQNYKAGLNKHKASSSFSDDFSSDYGF